tara:strand:+ start:26239 stop:26733 length:495 start_codon:yes stop_codon:yes gene_type:complete
MTLQSNPPPRKSTLSANVPQSIRNRVIELGEAYWNSKNQSDKIPARADIDPLDIPVLLPQVILLDVRRDPWDFRFRLIGTNVVHHLANDWTGTWMSEIEHMAPPSRIYNSCVDVAATGKPLRSDTPYVGPHRNYVRAEDIILPLASDGATPDMLLVFIEHFPKD